MILLAGRISGATAGGDSDATPSFSRSHHANRLWFWASKTLLSAVELELFSRIADGPKTGLELHGAMGLHPRGTYDFLDTLVALGLLQRDGAGETGKYGNTPATALFLVKRGPQNIGGILEMANARLYRLWGDLTPALKTGKPQASPCSKRSMRTPRASSSSWMR
jgi:hypothetical protein